MSRVRTQFTEQLRQAVTFYEQYAEAWERLRSADLFEQPWLDRFLNLVPANGELLDIGCGNGTPIAKYFTQQAFDVKGIDSSRWMIDAYQKNFHISNGT